MTVALRYSLHSINHHHSNQKKTKKMNSSLVSCVDRAVSCVLLGAARAVAIALLSAVVAIVPRASTPLAQI